MAVLAGLAIVVGMVGCGATTGSSTTAPAAKAPVSGVLLWQQNCGRCHNYRSPSEFSDAEWSIILQHMRVRVPLTGQQQKAILKFLQSANGPS